MLSLSSEDAEVIDREIRDAMTKLADGIDTYDADAATAEDHPVGPRGRCWE